MPPRYWRLRSRETRELLPHRGSPGRKTLSRPRAPPCDEYWAEAEVTTKLWIGIGIADAITSITHASGMAIAIFFIAIISSQRAMPTWLTGKRVDCESPAHSNFMYMKLECIGKSQRLN